MSYRYRKNMRKRSKDYQRARERNIARNQEIRANRRIINAARKRRRRDEN